MKARILYFLMLLIFTCCLNKVFAQYKGFGNTPFTLYYVIDVQKATDENQRIIKTNEMPSEVNYLGGYYGVMGYMTFYEDKIVVNDQITFYRMGEKESGSVVFADRGRSLYGKDILLLMEFMTEQNNILLKSPTPFFCIMTKKGSSKSNFEYRNIFFYTEKEWAILNSNYSESGNMPTNTYSSGYENNNTNTNTSNRTIEKAKEQNERYGYIDCHLCHGSGTCSTCNGKGWYYSPYGTGTVECPNCCYSNKGKCGKCCGTGKVYGKKY